MLGHQEAQRKLERLKIRGHLLLKKLPLLQRKNLLGHPGLQELQKLLKSLQQRSQNLLQKKLQLKSQPLNLLKFRLKKLQQKKHLLKRLLQRKKRHQRKQKKSKLMMAVMNGEPDLALRRNQRSQKQKKKLLQKRLHQLENVLHPHQPELDLRDRHLQFVVDEKQHQEIMYLMIKILIAQQLPQDFRRRPRSHPGHHQKSHPTNQSALGFLDRSTNTEANTRAESPPVQLVAILQFSTI